jgi:hypothetical protein
MAGFTMRVQGWMKGVQVKHKPKTESASAMNVLVFTVEVPSPKDELFDAASRLADSGKVEIRIDKTQTELEL